MPKIVKSKSRIMLPWNFRPTGLRTVCGVAPSAHLRRQIAAVSENLHWQLNNVHNSVRYREQWNACSDKMYYGILSLYVTLDGTRNNVVRNASRWSEPHHVYRCR